MLDQRISGVEKPEKGRSRNFYIILVVLNNEASIVIGFVDPSSLSQFGLSDYLPISSQ